mmetsp:Transcript_125585/g.313820  ORF Transcript_125585/g.313820 Transcript_125585/m.313820 type:complete len:524 (-) Transcript_125585:335-1906(-)
MEVMSLPGMAGLDGSCAEACWGAEAVVNKTRMPMLLSSRQQSDTEKLALLTRKVKSMPGFVSEAIEEKAILRSGSVISSTIGAAIAAMEGGDDMYRNATEWVCDRLREAYGQDLFEMLMALTSFVNDLGEEQLLQDCDSANTKFGLLLAVPLLGLFHEALPLPISCGEVNDLQVAREARYWVDYAASAYGSDDPEVIKQGSDLESVRHALGGKADVRLARLTIDGSRCPAHFLAIDTTSRCVVLAVRGSAVLADAVADALGGSAAAKEVLPEAPGVWAHGAALAGARSVLDWTRPALEEALAQHRGFRVLVTGHSHGAGVAVLCALLLELQPLPGTPQVQCFAYAPPPTIAPLSAPQIERLNVHAFVNRNDMVPRASMGSLIDLRREAMAVDRTDLTLFDRLELIRCGGGGMKGDLVEKRQKVIAAASAARALDGLFGARELPLPSLSIPGKVFWIEWPEEENQKLHRVDASQFGSLMFRGGRAVLKDHLCGSYREALSGVQARAALEAAIGRNCSKDQCTIC